MEDLDELNPMWWLNDSADDNEKSTSNTSNASLLDSFPSDDIRRCYSENNLLQLDSFDVQSAMVSVLCLPYHCLLRTMDGVSVLFCVCFLLSFGVSDGKDSGRATAKFVLMMCSELPPTGGLPDRVQFQCNLLRLSWQSVFIGLH
jgi:hypothetical protein